MSFRALAVDYDGTLAWHGEVDEPTLAALRKAKDAGLKLLMVTGREMPELRDVFPGHTIFDLIVGENGALLYEPVKEAYHLLAPKPPDRFFQMLTARGVKPISQGSVVVATWEPHQHTVLRTIHDLGLELDIIFNKGAVMVLPTGVNKGTGLHAAAKWLGIDASEVAGAGDAENDHSFAHATGFFAAVANAIPSLKERADWVTPSDHGAGVAELIDRLVSGELDRVTPRRARTPSLDHQPTTGR
ncbi:MAG: HAD family phosphatase [Myxococcaceae bacterium]|nr:HAD family phosphatase [Myxococcaceae bacterium]